MTIEILMLLLILLAISSYGDQEAEVIDELNSRQEPSQGVTSSDDDVSPSAEKRGFTLQAGRVDDRTAFVRVGGDIDGIVNPDLVILTSTNGDRMSHDFSVPGLGIKTSLANSKGASIGLNS